MTLTDTVQQELDALEERSRVLCPACAGTQEDWYLIGAPSDENWATRPCPVCNGSGLKSEGLSQVCWCTRADSLVSTRLHKDCQGSGRVPVSMAEARCWAEDWLLEKSGRIVIEGTQATNFRVGIPDSEDWEIDSIYVKSWSIAKTLALALFAALKETE